VRLQDFDAKAAGLLDKAAGELGAADSSGKPG